MTTKTTLTRPADLDKTKLHSPAEIRAHRAELEAYFTAVRAEADRMHKREEAARIEANRVLDENEYFELAQQREAEKQARQAERDAAERAEQERKSAYLASMPDVAEISATNPYSFTLQIIHWAGLGYVLPDGADVTALPTYYAAQLVKPAAKKAK